MKMRDKIKKPMTDRALQLLLNKLKGLSQDEEIEIKILENSIENCWQGIFPLREDNKAMFEVNGDNKVIFPIKAENKKIFSLKEWKDGNFGQNTGTSEKRFNVKIPKWEPNAIGQATNTKYGYGQTGEKDEPF